MLKVRKIDKLDLNLWVNISQIMCSSEQPITQVLILTLICFTYIVLEITFISFAIMIIKVS